MTYDMFTSKLSGSDGLASSNRAAGAGEAVASHVFALQEWN